LPGQFSGRPFPSTGAFSETPHELPRAMQARPLRRGAIDAFVKTCQWWLLSEDEQIVLLGCGANPLLAPSLALCRRPDFEVWPPQCMRKSRPSTGGRDIGPHPLGDPQFCFTTINRADKVKESQSEVSIPRYLGGAG
jgi:hypothetical protein